MLNRIASGLTFIRYRRRVNKLFKKTYCIEQLEDRRLLAVTWVEQGPFGADNNGNATNLAPNDRTAGAVHVIVAHPTDANTLYAGGVNGGIWKTTNATAASPTWIPQTDFLGSLSMGAMQLDPTDATNNTLVAGTARYSSFAGIGGARGAVIGQ